MNASLVQLGGMWCPPNDPYFGPLLAHPAGLLLDGQVMNAAFERVTDLRCAVDVGAHIGIWTRQLAQRFNTVIALEPDGLNFAALQTNLRDVGNTRLLPLGLAKYPGRFTLSRKGTQNSGQGYLTPLQADGEWAVAITLDTLDLGALGLLKLDVEGLEHDVILGGEHTIRKHRPVIVLEENAAAGRYGHKPGDARAILEGWGMQEVARFEFAPNNFDVIMDWKEPS